jgi:predicted nucleic acid-binding Zn ribbon protein
MPVYRYQHECGYDGEIFLHTEKTQMLVTCAKCGRKVMAKVLQDSSIIYKENDGVTGVLEKTKPTKARY